MENSKSKTQNPKLKIQNLKYKTQNPKHKNQTYILARVCYCKYNPVSMPEIAFFEFPSHSRNIFCHRTISLGVIIRQIKKKDFEKL